MPKREEPLAHLARNRPAILQRAAVAAIAGLVPIPVLDDLLASAVRATLLRQIAESRQVDADDAALAHVADVAVRSSLAGAGLLGLPCELSLSRG